MSKCIFRGTETLQWIKECMRPTKPETRIIFVKISERNYHLKNEACSKKNVYINF
jgi:hypothetical protein